MRTPQLGCVVAVMVGVVAGRCGESHGADPTRGAISDDKATPQREAATEEPAARPLTINRTGPEPPPAVAPLDAEQARKHQEAWALHLGLPVEWTNSIGMKCVLIPPGEFMMGSAESPEELAKAFPGTGPDWLRRAQLPQHRVRITRPFCLGVNEVTVGQFRQFVEATDYRTDAERDGKGGSGWRGMKWSWGPEFTWRNIGIPQPEMYPVVNVTWNDAVAFCQWLSGKEGRTYRLPTEAAWEYACRGGAGTPFHWGAALEGTEANCDGNRRRGWDHTPRQCHTPAVAQLLVPKITAGTTTSLPARTRGSQPKGSSGASTSEEESKSRRYQQSSRSLS